MLVRFLSYVYCVLGVVIRAVVDFVVRVVVLVFVDMVLNILVLAVY